MVIVASEEARELIAEQGGRLYVFVKAGRCCGGTKMLAAKTAVKDDGEYASVGTADGFELFFPHDARLPAELRVEARRFPRRIEAYWDGCAWVV